jgi:hypothetical protein
MTAPTLDDYRELADRLLSDVERVLNWHAHATLDGASDETLRTLDTIADGLRTVIYLLGYAAGGELRRSEEVRGAWRASDARPCTFCNGLRFIYRGREQTECERCGGTGVQPKAPP